MDGKDNRSRDKRHKMKTHYRNKKRHGTASSSSEHVDITNCSLRDAIDSSDETCIDTTEWLGRAKAPSKVQYKSRLHDAPPDENEENEQMFAGDFKLMSQVPATVGGHFTFASEKRWETAENEEFIDNTEASEYFTLNLKLLNAGLQSIPFYKRLDYTADMFTKLQLLAMEEEAEAAEKSYQDILREHLQNPQLRGRKSANGRPTTAKVNHPLNGDVHEPDELDELDELLNLSINKSEDINLKSNGGHEQTDSNKNHVEQLNPMPDVDPTIERNQKDMQEWLDNVLEE